MRRTAWVVTAAVIAAVVLGGARMMGADGQGNDERGRGKECSEATVRGDYGIQIQGTRPAPGGLIESVIGIVLRSYDGHGNFSQVSNVKGSITGTVPDSQGVGTYEVNADCTGIVRFQPAPGVLLEERLVIVDNGREIRTAVMVPAAVMITGVHQRIHSR
jgi:archaellin